MKLPRSLVDHIAHQVVRELDGAGLVELKNRPPVTESLANAFAEDLMVEDRLNEEVREIMRTYQDEMTRTGVQYHEMFKKIKKELVRKRTLIL